MHSQRICHRDLKPDNVLAADDFSVKIIDFNTAAKADADLQVSGGMGLKEWSAPETRLGLRYGLKCDEWSLGLILAYMLSGYTPECGESWENIRENALVKC